MNINVQKIRLIKWINQIDDTMVLDELLEIQRKNQSDWWDDLDEHEKNEIEMGLNDLAEGNIVNHSQARNLYEKYL